MNEKEITNLKKKFRKGTKTELFETGSKLVRIAKDNLKNEDFIFSKLIELLFEKIFG